MCNEAAVRLNPRLDPSSVESTLLAAHAIAAFTESCGRNGGGTYVWPFRCPPNCLPRVRGRQPGYPGGRMIDASLVAPMVTVGVETILGVQRN